LTIFDCHQNLQFKCTTAYELLAIYRRKVRQFQSV